MAKRKKSRNTNSKPASNTNKQQTKVAPKKSMKEVCSEIWKTQKSVFISIGTALIALFAMYLPYPISLIFLLIILALYTLYFIVKVVLELLKKNDEEKETQKEKEECVSENE